MILIMQWVEIQYYLYNVKDKYLTCKSVVL
ncbi:hypothetical protein FlaCF_3515 [Flavobacterium tructae]